MRKSSEIAEVCWVGNILRLINVWFCGVDGVVKLKRWKLFGFKGTMKKRRRGSRSKEGGIDEGHVNFDMRLLFGEGQKVIEVEEVCIHLHRCRAFCAQYICPMQWPDHMGMAL